MFGTGRSKAYSIMFLYLFQCVLIIHNSHLSFAKQQCNSDVLSSRSSSGDDIEDDLIDCYTLCFFDEDGDAKAATRAFGDVGEVINCLGDCAEDASDDFEEELDKQEDKRDDKCEGKYDDCKVDCDDVYGIFDYDEKVSLYKI